VAAGQLGLNRFFVPNPRKTSIQLLLEAQKHKKFAQTTPLDDDISYLLLTKNIVQFLKPRNFLIGLKKTVVFISKPMFSVCKSVEKERMTSNTELTIVFI
jgi:hypothetical protein